jgi:predicted transcriptional regulator
MLQSQFTANAQHPDKYDGQEFESRKATHLPLDGSKLTPEEIRFLEANAFKFPQLAEKYRVHEVMQGKSKREVKKEVQAKPLMTSKIRCGRTVKKMERRQAICKFLEGLGWVKINKVATEFNIVTCTAAADLKALEEAGFLETRLVPMSSGGPFREYRRTDCDTLSS